MQKYSILAMKHIYISFILIFTLLFSLFTVDLKAQANFGRKEWGPTFITSASFLNGIHKTKFSNQTKQNTIPVIGISNFSDINSPLILC